MSLSIMYLGIKPSMLKSFFLEFYILDILLTTHWNYNIYDKVTKLQLYPTKIF